VFDGQGAGGHEGGRRHLAAAGFRVAFEVGQGYEIARAAARIEQQVQPPFDGGADQSALPAYELLG